MKKNLFYLLLLLVAATACDDEIRWEDEGSHPTENSVSGLYILCEGLFNMNNSTVSYYDFTKGEMISFQDADKGGSNKTSYDFFKKQNGRKLGDTANDLKRYGSKLWCAVNVSSQLEIIDVYTGKSLRQIPLFNESGIGRQPRCLAFDNGKAYVCNFDGTVARIDTASLQVESIVKVGRNPDGICVSNGKLYVSNSGGLDSGNPDNTVSVIDINAFRETKRITVRENPGTILADIAGNVYVVSRGRYNEATTNYDCRLHRIDSQTDEVAETFNWPVMSFCISGYKAYLYSYQSDKDAVLVMDTRTGQLTDQSFVKDNTQFTHIYNISVNPINQDVYICDALNYTVNGLVYCFGSNGQRKFTLDAKGLNPKALVFTDAPYQDLPEEPETDIPQNNQVSRVLEYKPAAGQFVNKLPPYEEGDDEQDMCRKCLEYFNQEYLISLGGFGGYITVSFDAPVVNRKDAPDFRIFGNSFDGAAEPGIVLVSADTNGNQLPDDTWYELKGSEYDNPACIRNYEITYHRPANPTDRVRWTDNQGKEGAIERTEHTQCYYPLWVTDSTLTFGGTRLPDNGKFDTSLNKWVMTAYAYGYADNQSNSQSNFNLEWAVDNNGNPVALEQIDFIRIYTAVNQQIPSGAVGELSTEIKGIEIIAGE